MTQKSQNITSVISAIAAVLMSIFLLLFWFSDKGLANDASIKAELRDHERRVIVLEQQVKAISEIKQDTKSIKISVDRITGCINEIKRELGLNGRRIANRRTDSVFTGIASWYGEYFHGRKTANGERYDMHAMTAAHKKLKFNTIVEVTNKHNSKRCTVRINDRGPFIKGRVIDLSKAAAEAINLKLGPVICKIIRSNNEKIRQSMGLAETQ